MYWTYIQMYSLYLEKVKYMIWIYICTSCTWRRYNTKSGFTDLLPVLVEGIVHDLDIQMYSLYLEKV